MKVIKQERRSTVTEEGNQTRKKINANKVKVARTEALK